jgi:hypothetical protein
MAYEIVHDAIDELIKCLIKVERRVQFFHGEVSGDDMHEK